MSDVPVHPVKCAALCGRVIGYSDLKQIPVVIICQRCLYHPEEIEKRMGASR